MALFSQESEPPQNPGGFTLTVLVHAIKEELKRSSPDYLYYNKSSPLKTTHDELSTHYERLSNEIDLKLKKANEERIKNGSTFGEPFSKRRRIGGDEPSSGIQMEKGIRLGADSPHRKEWPVLNHEWGEIITKNDSPINKVVLNPDASINEKINLKLPEINHNLSEKDIGVSGTIPQQPAAKVEDPSKCFEFKQGLSTGLDFF
jgi:hypothetical protein